MRASFYQGNRTFTTGTAPMPTPAAGEALLRIRRVGICGSDLHIFQGHLDHRVPKGNTIGHEVLAEVVSSPDAAFAPGDRVVVEPVLYCGTCRACRIGASYLCYHLKVLGVDAPGGMQEYWAVPTHRLLKVPTTLKDDDAALIEPLAVAVHDVTRAEVKSGDSVVVFGGGPIGCLIALVCRHRGARVKVVEINPHRLSLLKSIGLETIGPEQDTIRTVLDWTDGDGADVAFEVSGSPDPVRIITQLVRVWGTVSIIAIHAEPVTINLYPMFGRELKMHGSRLYTRAAWEESIRLLATGAIVVSPLVSRKIPLEDLQKGMEEALGGGPVMKVLVDMAG
ncbi:MAG TPA: alcohol dehydrogenase catalytic domain-containing protein [Vicinamibacterales bacterium]|jgi:2-desacetyl-2-hydroxyethyl bacteriochlorophyllide A dehydrogenase|nr:alcohol dehydrogenase catalytic domain-containing protein [Vicinamibacterales bacterium]